LKSCKQCGTCCRRGGPALHKEDFRLFKNGKITITNLVCIRKGEPVYSPIIEGVEPAAKEILKLSGGNSWQCPFLETDTNLCAIYQHRPMECGLLKCWDNTAITEIIYKDVINRWDLIGEDQPIKDLIKLHDRECSYLKIIAAAELGQRALAKTAQEIISRDLAIREKAITTYNLSLAQELFYFGRPMFKSIDYFTKAK